MDNKFLPVGSAVMLKGATRAIIIVGYSVIEEDKSQVWDYLGCAYPFGVIDTDKNLLFNRDQIEKVLFEGYSDDEGQRFLKMLEEQMEKINSEKQ